MTTLTRNRILSLSILLLLPAAFIITSGVLDVAFDVEAADRLFGAAGRTPLGAVLFAPPVVLGAAAVAVMLNVSRFVRVWFDREPRTINLSVSFAGTTAYMVTAYVAATTISILLLYGAKYAIRAAVVELLR